MKDNILDEIEKSQFENKKPINRIIQISIGSVFLFLLFEEARKNLPENLFELEDVQIKTVGILIMVVVILLSILIPNNLNKIYPKLNIAQVVIYTGIIFMGIEIAFKLVQNFFIFNNAINDIKYIHIIRPAIIMGGIGMLIANIRIHKLRGKKTLTPILILIGIWITSALFLKI